MKRIILAMFSLMLMCSHNAYAYDGCFSNEKYDDNVLLVLVHDIYGETTQGTAFITKDHHVLTARHLISNEVRDINVYWANGDSLGVIDMSNLPRKNYNQGLEYIKNDYADISLLFDSDKQKDRFNKTSGFTIRNDGNIYRFQVDGPLGIFGGASGAPVIDNDEQVVGILSSSTQTKDTVYSESIQNMKRNEASDRDDDVSFPTANFGYSTPIPGNGAPLKLDSPLIVDGYPKRFCVAYKVHIKEKKEKVRLEQKPW